MTVVSKDGKIYSTTFSTIIKAGQYIYIYYDIIELGARPLEGRGFFVINGVSWMILDVLVPIGFCLMCFLRPLTSYSGAYFQKQAFRLDETTIFEVFENSSTNST